MENKDIHRLPIRAFWAFALRIFRSFNGLQLFSDLFHEALYILWMMIIEKHGIAVVRLMDFLPLRRIKLLAVLIGPLYPMLSVVTPNQARSRFSLFVICLCKKKGFGRLKVFDKFLAHSIDSGLEKKFLKSK
jgi:hypothetical protein